MDSLAVIDKAGTSSDETDWPRYEAAAEAFSTLNVGESDNAESDHAESDHAENDCAENDSAASDNAECHNAESESV